MSAQDTTTGGRFRCPPAATSTTSGKDTRTRAFRPAPPGARSPTTRRVPTAGCAIRSTSSPTTPQQPEPPGTNRGPGSQATVTPARVPYSVAARQLLRDTLLDAARDQLVSRRWVDGHHGRHRPRRRCQPPDALQGVPLARPVRAGPRHARGRPLPARPSKTPSTPTSTTPPARSPPPSTSSSRRPAENSLVRTIVHGDGAEELLALFTTHGQPLVQRAAERLTTVMLASWPLLRASRRRAAQRVPRPPRHQLRRPAHRPRQHDRPPPSPACSGPTSSSSSHAASSTEAPPRRGRTREGVARSLLLRGVYSYGDTPRRKQLTPPTHHRRAATSCARGHHHRHRQRRQRAVERRQQRVHRQLLAAPVKAACACR